VERATDIAQPHWAVEPSSDWFNATRAPFCAQLNPVLGTHPSVPCTYTDGHVMAQPQSSHFNGKLCDRK